MKKIVAMLLALVMMALPFAGLAELDLKGMLNEVKADFKDAAGKNYQQNALEAGRRVTANVTLDWLPESLTGEAAVDQVINDIVDNLGMSWYEQNDEVYFSLGMKQESGEMADLITFGGAVKGEELFLSSNLLGGTFALTADEALPLLERLMDMLAMIGMIEESDLEQAKAMLPEMLPAISDYSELMGSAMALNKLDVLSLNYNAIKKAVKPIVARMETADVLVQPKNCDAAVSAVTLDITGEDAIALLKAMVQFIEDNAVLRDYYDQYFAYMISMEPSMAEELGADSFSGMMDKMIAELEKTDMEGTMHLYMGLDAQGRPVSAELTVPGEEVAVVYTRLTQNNGVAHCVVFDMDDVDMTIDVLDAGKTAVVNVAMAEDGETIMNVKVDVTDRSAENLIAFDMTMVMDINDEEMPMSIKLALSDDVNINGVDYDEKMDMIFSVNDVDFLAAHAVIQSAEPGASITDGEVVRPAQLSEADFANWFVGVYNSLFSWVSGVIMKLPVSVQNLLMSGY